MEWVAPVVLTGVVAATVMIVLTAAFPSSSLSARVSGPDRQDGALARIGLADRHSVGTNFSDPTFDPFQFGRSGVPSGLAASRPDAADAASSGLPQGIRLHAVRVNSTGQSVRGSGTAIISVAEGPQQVFQTGDMIRTGIRLISVAGDHVLLSVEGETARLDLSGGARGLSDTNPGALESRVKLPNDANRAPDMELGTFRYAPSALARSLSLAPVRKGSDWLGYEVLPSAQPNSRTVLSESGFRPGDVLISANGLWVTEDTREAFLASLALGRAIDIVVDRGSQRGKLRLEAESSE